MKFSAILFDLDGTLVDSIPDLAAAANAMRADLQLPALPQELLATFVGKGAEVLVRRALSGHLDGDFEMVKAALNNEVHEAYVADALALFKRHYRACNGRFTRVYAGVLEGLNALQAAQIPLGVVTNKPLEFTLPLLQQIELADYFKVVVGGDTTPQKKPHPLPLLHACAQLTVLPAHTLMVGDSHNDAQAAHAAGMPCWLVPYGYNEGESVAQVVGAMQNMKADDIVSSIAAVAQRLLN